MPAVSVITPVFNAEPYIGAAIESVLGQSVGDWELLVIDDGSTDATPDVVREYAGDPRLRVVRREHRGLSAARNEGVSRAMGRLLAFLDADDLWSPEYLERMVSMLDRRPEAVLAFAGWRYVDAVGTVLPQFVVPFGGDPARAERELPWRNAIVPSAAVAQTAAVRRVGGFDTALHACEDWDLWIRLREEGPFVGLSSDLVLYRAHGESMTEDGEAIERERLKVNEKHHGALSGDVASWPFPRRRAVGHTLFVSALAAFRVRDGATGAAKLREALTTWPELSDEEEFYYELACSHQARGLRGTAVGGNADAAELLESLRTLFHGRASWGRAQLALANVALLAGDRRSARHYGSEALRFGGLRSKARAFETMLASWLPAGWLRRLRGWRHALRGRPRAAS
jgi:glycosyltransferase involved in cell wall biosynthesis